MRILKLSLLQVIWLKEVYVCSCFYNIVFVTLGTHCNLDPRADVKNKNLDIHYLKFKMMEHLCKQGSPLVKTVIFFFISFSFFSGTYTLLFNQSPDDSMPAQKQSYSQWVLPSSCALLCQTFVASLTNLSLLSLKLINLL